MSPIGFLVCGPSGVGKTTHFYTMLENAGVKQKVFLIDPDARKEEPAERSRLALEEVRETIDKGISFGYTATCASGKVIHELISKMKAKRYRIIIAIVYTSLSTALERIQKRTHQMTPGSVVEDLHAFFKTKAERFMKLPVEVYLYNNEEQLSLLLTKNKKIVCRTPDADFFFDISKYC